MSERSDIPVGSLVDSTAWLHPELERALEVFELAWQDRSAPDLDQFLHNRSDLLPEQFETLLAELVKIDMEYRWRRSASAGVGAEQAPAESFIPPAVQLDEYLSRYPQLRVTVDLVLEEYQLRWRYGDCPEAGVYLRRYPEMATQLQAVLRMSHPPDSPDDDSVYKPNASDIETSAPSDQTPTWQAAATQAAAAEGSAPTSAWQPGDLMGRYSIERFLGEGAFGQVLLAHDPELQRPVVLKLTRPDRMQGTAARKELLREARLAATIRHPGIVSIYDIAFNGPRCAIVMEYVPGSSLAELLAKKALRRMQGLELLVDVCEAVHAAHTAGLIHRDLKPANILVDQQGRPRVADFGLAVRTSEQRRTAWTVSGSPAYMAPEQIRGESHRLDGRTDLWAIGIILYELLVGKRPFSGANIDSLFEEALYRDPRPPRQSDDSVSPELERICLRCLSKAMADRYTTVRDLAMELRKQLRLVRLQSGARFSESFTECNSTISKGNIPAAPDTFFGRLTELTRVTEFLRGSQPGIATIMGASGMGKTRLALEAARQLRTAFPGGCWYVDISSAATPEALCRSVLLAWGISSEEDLPQEECLLQVLALRPPLLLVLDGLDRASGGIAGVLKSIAQQAPQSRVLVVAGQRVGQPGEQVVTVAGLPIPREGMTSAELEASPSAQLFVDAARRSGADVDLAADAPRLIRVCQQLEGIPLAIELAAARLSVLTLAQLEQRIAHRFQVLRSTRHDLPDRQRTMWAAMEATFELLDSWEKDVLRQLSAFPGGFDLEAAEAVVSFDRPGAPPSARFDAPAVIDVVQALRERSLLSSSDSSDGRRFSVLRTIREFCAERAAPGDSSLAAPDAQFWQRLAQHLLPVAQVWSQRLRGCERCAALGWFRKECENLEAVQAWTQQQPDAELAGELTLACDYFLAATTDSERRIAALTKARARATGILQIRLTLREAEAWQVVGAVARAEQAARQALTAIADLGSNASPALREQLTAEGLVRLATIDRVAGRVQQARDHLAQAAQLILPSVQRDLRAEIALERGLLHRLAGEWKDALAEFDQVSRSALAAGNELMAAVAMRLHSHVLARLGRFAEARDGLSRALHIAEAGDDRRLLHLSLTSLGMVNAEVGDFTAAVDCYSNALQIATQLGQRRAMATNLGNRGLAWADLGRFEEAVVELAAAEQLNRELENRAGLALNLANRGVALVMLGRLSEAEPLLHQSLEMHQEQENHEQEAQVRAEIGWLEHLRGQHAAALVHLQAAVAQFASLQLQETPDGLLMLTQLANVLAAAGQPSESQELAAHCRSVAVTLRIDANHPRVRLRDACSRLASLDAAPS